MRMLIWWVLVQSGVGMAATLEFSGTPEPVKIRDVTLSVYPRATLKVAPSQAYPLTLSGAGIRKKTLLKVKVYWVSSYLAGSEALVQVPTGTARAGKRTG